MNDNPQNPQDPHDPLERWMFECFKREESDPTHYPSFRKLFVGEVEEINREFKIDVLVNYIALMDPEEPEDGTCREFVERSANDKFGCYKAAIDEGHGTAYSEAYGRIAGGGECIENASAMAYEAINNNGDASPDNPAYKDAYDACESKKGERFARRCAVLVAENPMAFPAAFKAAAKEEIAYLLMLGRGHTDLWARMYVEALRTYSEEFAGIYAGCVEAEIAAGRNQDDAEKFAEIHAAVISEGGGLDEDDPENWRCELWYRAKAEAAYRHRREFGDKERFVETFDLIHQRLSDSPQAGSRDWFDDVEARALQRIAAQDVYKAEHGNLRGFDDEGQPPVEPYRIPTGQS